MKIYVVGTGGVGGYFGGLMAKGGLDVTFVARGDDNFRQIQNNGLLVKNTDKDFLVKPAKVIRLISEIEKPNLILITVKTYDTKITAQELLKVVNKNTVIITFQNGINNDEIIKKEVKLDNVFPGVAYVISSKTKPGVIEQIGGLQKLIVGDKKKEINFVLRNIVNTVKKSGIDITLSDDITRDLWQKYLFIIPFAGMTAICRSAIGKVLEDPFAKSIYEKCLREALMIAKLKKINLPNNIFEDVMAKSEKTAPNSKSSLLVDIENNRKTEIETLHGTLVKYAKELDVEIPINELIYTSIKMSNI